MKMHSQLQPIYESKESETEIVINCSLAFDPVLEPISKLEIPLDYIIASETPILNEQAPTFESTSIEPFDIEDSVFEETYTAYVTKRSTKWCGWIPDFPEVECEEKTKTELLKTLTDKLHEALESEEEEWGKQFEEDVKAGWLDHLSEKAVQNYQAGRYYDLETPKKKL